MYHELTLHTGVKKHKAFLQDGFYSPAGQTIRLHKHNYAEIHAVTGTDARLIIGDGEYDTAKGNLLLIPPDVYHCFARKDETTLHTAFQVDLTARELCSCTVSDQIVREFLHEIENCKQTRDYTRVSVYMALLCSYFNTAEPLHPEPMNDYGVLIHQFFSGRYSEDVRLEDLANALNLSQRQAERLVIQYTGHTFREELTAMRINTAKHLLKTSNMSRGQIAQYVGFHSYAGFWKAMKKASFGLTEAGEVL